MEPNRRVPRQTSMRAILVAALLMTGCAGLGDEAGPGAGPDDPGVSTPPPQTPEPGPSYMEVEPRQGLGDVVPHIWDRAKATDPTHVRVEFYGGVEECEGLDRVEVDETAETV